MTKVEPYLNLEDAKSALDNGGRFYNIFTKAEDNLISKSEVSKVAGLFSDRQKLILAC